MEKQYTIDNNGQIMCDDVVVVMEENDFTYVAYIEFLNSGGTVKQLDEPDINTTFTGVRSAKYN